jgi:hypothetical protein
LDQLKSKPAWELDLMRARGWWHLAMSLAASIFISTLLNISPARASSQLDALYLQVLKRPADSQLNLDFARAAESAGVLRWALSAYERVTVNDPGNTEAQAGLQRVRRKLQPDYSQMTVQLGSAVESNPRYYLGPRRTELEGLASLSLRDERAINGQRWRTTGVIAGQIYSQSGDLGYGYAGLNTGPVLDLFSGVSMVPAVGGAAAYYDQHFYYGEGVVSATFEGASQVLYRSLQLKVAYRSYDDFFPSGDGFYTEARGGLAFPNALGNSGVVILSPWVLYSDISGSVISPALTDLAPGVYVEAGGKIEGYRKITDWLIAGASLLYSRRAYRNDVAPTGDKRADNFLVPGVTLLFPHILSYQTDLRFDYRYLWNDSNDPTKSFTDHMVTATLILRFDPRQPFWAQTISLPGAR